MTNVYKQKPDVVGEGENARVVGGKYDGWLASCVPQSYWEEQAAIREAESEAEEETIDTAETVEPTEPAKLPDPVTLDAATEGQAPSADPEPEAHTPEPTRPHRRGRKD